MNICTAKACAVAVILLAPMMGLGQAPFIPQEAMTAPQPETLEGSRPHVYKSIGGANLRLHVYDRRSKSDVRSPAIVFFFGGSWTIGSVLHFVPQAKHFAQRGIVAIVADYRVSSRHNTTAFESMSDAKSAVRWVRAHANELGVDANRIVAAGGSAGGHIALSTAVFDAFDETNEGKSTSSKPNALVLFNPEVDTTDTPSHATFADLRARFGAKARDGSPIHHLRAGLPPTLILHGKDDTLVAYSDVDRFCKESSGLGNLCQIVGYEGAGHSFFNPDRADGKWYRETLLEADRFLTKLGYLSAPSPMQIQ